MGSHGAGAARFAWNTAAHAARYPRADRRRTHER